MESESCCKLTKIFSVTPSTIGFQLQFLFLTAVDKLYFFPE